MVLSRVIMTFILVILAANCQVRPLLFLPGYHQPKLYTVSLSNTCTCIPVTSYFRMIGHTHRTDAIKSGSHFAGAAGPVSILVSHVITRKWIAIVIIEIMTSFRILEEKRHRIYEIIKKITCSIHVSEAWFICYFLHYYYMTFCFDALLYMQ